MLIRKGSAYRKESAKLNRYGLFFFFIFFFNPMTAPYDSYRPTKESTVRAFWVQASPEGQTHKLGVPMLMNISPHQDQFLTQDLLNELVNTAF